MNMQKGWPSSLRFKEIFDQLSYIESRYTFKQLVSVVENFGKHDGKSEIEPPLELSWSLLRIRETHFLWLDSQYLKPRLNSQLEGEYWKNKGDEMKWSETNNNHTF